MSKKRTSQNGSPKPDTTMRKAPSQPDNHSSNTVQIKGDPSDRPRLVAQITLTPSLQAAATIKQWSKVIGDVGLMGLINELREQAANASSGDLKRHEAILTIQAHTLDTVFNELARRSQANLGEYMDAADRYMRLALKAQSQCRATIETLAEIKNPKPVAFVQQANIANGPQQVNNGPFRNSTDNFASAREINSVPNELLGKSNGERLDVHTQGPAIRTDSSLEAVGAVNGAKNDRGEG